MTWLGPIPCDQIPSPPVKGVTVGNTGADINGNDQTALERALVHSRSIMLLPGTVLRFTAPFVSAADDVSIWSPGRATIVPSSNATFGALSLTGARPRLSGVYFRDELGVANQTVVALQGHDALVDLCAFEQLVAGNPALSTHILSFGNQDNATRTNGGRALGNRFIPNIGSVCLQALFQTGPKWHGNKIQAATEGVDTDCRAAFATNSCEGMSLIGNDLIRLGTAGQTMDGIWRERALANGNGGNVFAGNTIKGCRFNASGIFFNGSSGWAVVGNSFADLNTMTTTFWNLDVDAGTGRPTRRVTFAGNTWDSVGQNAAGSAMLMADVELIRILGDQFINCPTRAIDITSSDVPGGTVNALPANSQYFIAIQNCAFLASGSVGRPISNGTAANFWRFSENQYDGFSLGFSVAITNGASQVADNYTA